MRDQESRARVSGGCRDRVTREGERLRRQRETEGEGGEHQIG